MANWPDSWSVEQADLAIGQRIVEAIKPFLVNLLKHGLADKTLARHRDNLWMLGGEIIRRRHDDPDLAIWKKNSPPSVSAEKRRVGI